MTEDMKAVMDAHAEKIKFDLIEPWINSEDRERPLTEHEIDELADKVLREQAYYQNKGYGYTRLAFNPRERAFHEQWMHENRPVSGIDFGQGILQNLFIEPNPNTKGLTQKWHLHINNRDRYVVATVIQWLGTNVGMSFLHEALKKCGMKIASIENK